MKSKKETHSDMLKHEISCDSGISDSELASWLEDRQSSGKAVGYAYANHYFKVFESNRSPSIMISGDLGKETMKILKKLSKSKKLKYIELSLEQIESTNMHDPSWILSECTIDNLTALYKDREKLFGQGRGKAISKHTAAKVWHDAGGRCMYRGCGSDLGETPLTTQKAQIAYLAHIVASDPDGPRGSYESHFLSDSSENIMLMCDAHHRLIDRIDVTGHPVQLLQEMREEHVIRVKSLLNGLCYPRAQVITLLSDLGQVPTNVSQTVLFDSVLSRKLGPLPTIKHMIRRTQRDDRARSGFWSHFLSEHESDIRDFITFNSNRPSQSAELTPDVLAIFPLHLVPVLILAGRIIGEARNVEVFQYDRDLKTWQWQKDTQKSNTKFSIVTEIAHTKTHEETILSLELTANVDPDHLNLEMSNAIREQRINWIRIKNENPNYNCINTKKNLEEFSKLAREAIKTIQDNWKSKKVHVFGISPASALFKFGQMLQAGHHPVYQLYDKPDGSTMFIPALELTGNQIKSANEKNTPSYSINLR